MLLHKSVFNNVMAEVATACAKHPNVKAEVAARKAEVATACAKHPNVKAEVATGKAEVATACAKHPNVKAEVATGKAEVATERFGFERPGSFLKVRYCTSIN